jgi:hypothetical protein
LLTLTEAAKAVGMSRAGLFKAVKRGNVSASKDDNGHYLIDPAELFRVYQPVNVVDVSSKQKETEKLTVEAPELTAKIEAMAALLDQVKSERDYLRNQLDKETEERRRLTNLLTHQPEPPAHAPAAATYQNSSPADSKLWAKLFGSYRTD